MEWPDNSVEAFDDYGEKMIEMEESLRNGVHVTKGGRELKLSEMETGHLESLLKMLSKHPIDTTPISNELERRANQPTP